MSDHSQPYSQGCSGCHVSKRKKKRLLKDLSEGEKEEIGKACMMEGELLKDIAERHGISRYLVSRIDKDARKKP